MAGASLSRPDSSNLISHSIPTRALTALCWESGRAKLVPLSKERLNPCRPLAVEKGPEPGLAAAATSAPLRQLLLFPGHLVSPRFASIEAPSLSACLTLTSATAIPSTGV